MANEIKFEMGQIDPRRWYFDHHGEISHSHAFVAKMSSVQLLEALMASGKSITEFQVDLNHTGHLDDFVLHAIQPAEEDGKLRSLYAWACQVSCIDSLGPVAYRFLQKGIVDLVNTVYQCYQTEISRLAEEAGVDRWKLPLDQKILASKKAGMLLVESLEDDNYQPQETWQPPEGTWRLDDFNNRKYAVIKVLDSSFNPIRASAKMFELHPDATVMVAYKKDESGRLFYSICARSAYHADLSAAWNKLTAADKIPKGCSWGGHSGVGGSARKSGDFVGGSCLTPEEVVKIIDDSL